MQMAGMNFQTRSSTNTL
ncbi:MAG: DUF6783 domain-containing protein [Clostridiales bacterium]|nr:DUF6783 domain-containing protein [Clostridiales bacterium]